jgi:hypothetical protein
MERLPHFGAENESASDSKQLGCSRFPAAGPPAHARYAPRTAIVVLIVLPWAIADLVRPPRSH